MGGGVKRQNHNPDRNIWNNNGTFWCHDTVHNEDYTKQRVRVSLGTEKRLNRTSPEGFPHGRDTHNCEQHPPR